MFQLNSKNVKQKIIQHAKDYQVRVFFNRNSSVRGEARFWRRSISINYNYDPSVMMSTFFHELAHIYCYDNDLWKNYHTCKKMSELNEREKQLLIRTAVRAEKWCDKWAEKEMKRHYPDLPYFTTYNDTDVIKQFKIDIKLEVCWN